MTVQIGETVPLLESSPNDNGFNVAARKITVPDGYTILSLSIYAETGAGNVRLAIYAADGAAGIPLTLKAQTASAVAVTGWNTLPVLATARLTAGNYWLAYQIDNGAFVNRQKHNNAGDSVYYVTGYAAFDALFNTTVTPDIVYYSLYGTFDTPGGGGGGGNKRKRGDIRRTTFLRPDRLKFEDWQAFSDYREEAQKLRAELAKPKPAPAKVAAAVERVRKVVTEVAPDYDFVSAKADAEAIRTALDEAQKFLAKMAQEFVERQRKAEADRDKEEQDVIQAVTDHEMEIIRQLLH